MPRPSDPHTRLTLAWRTYRAAVVDASRRWSRLSPAELATVRAGIDAARAEVLAAEAAYDAPIPYAIVEKGAA